MTDPVVFPAGLQRFASLEDFYEADERRRHSGEADYGVYWWDGEQGHSDTWRVSAVAATGEIYALRMHRNLYRPHSVDLVLLGRVAPADPSYLVSDRILAEWNLTCGESFSLQWVISRVLEATGEYPAPLSILCRTQVLGDHVHVDVFVGRQAGSRGRAGELILRGDEWDVFRAGLEAGFGDRLEFVASAAGGGGMV